MIIRVTSIFVLWNISNVLLQIIINIMLCVFLYNMLFVVFYHKDAAFDYALGLLEKIAHGIIKGRS